ncbi:hypothetical protein QYE76_051755 [Lolium multiflorum]|uniref:Uncharacterized protein n=1 Tax=Lolium multiflorum TaxID=4521 RepID=A0AAD8WIW1_LOLMU|nr:hypothetical protein QYE76_051755 [Lolium multiflorum]
MGKRSKKSKVILPPPLPPDVDDEEIFISDEDVYFVENYSEHIRWIAGLDNALLDKVVSRVADHDDDKVELLYQKRERKRRAADALHPRNDDDREVEPVDALPVKLEVDLVSTTDRRSTSSAEPEVDGGRCWCREAKAIRTPGLLQWWPGSGQRSHGVVQRKEITREFHGS